MALSSIVETFKTVAAKKYFVGLGEIPQQRLAVQTWEPEFNLQNPNKNQAHMIVTLTLEKWREEGPCSFLAS